MDTKLKLGFTTLLLCGCIALMAPSGVQQIVATQTPTGVSLAVIHFAVGGVGGVGTTASCTAINTTTHNLLVVGVRTNNSTLASGVSDTINTFTPIVASQGLSGTAESGLWYAKDITGNATDTITATFTASNATAIACWEIAGASTSAPLDTSAYGNNGGIGSTTVTSASFSTANANEIVVALASAGAINETLTAQSGYTLDSGTFPTSTISNYQGAEHIIFSSTQSAITTGMTLSGSTLAGISVGAFTQ